MAVPVAVRPNKHRSRLDQSPGRRVLENENVSLLSLRDTANTLADELRISLSAKEYLEEGGECV